MEKLKVRASEIARRLKIGGRQSTGCSKLLQVVSGDESHPADCINRNLNSPCGTLLKVREKFMQGAWHGARRPFKGRPRAGGNAGPARRVEPLDDDARQRVLAWAIARFDVQLSPKQGRERTATSKDNGAVEETAAPVGPIGVVSGFSTLGELFAAAEPATNGEKALVAAYWQQVKGGAPDFGGQEINTELKHLGHGVSNITKAIDELKNKQPALAIQLRKGGSSQQARKRYKVTEAGVKRLTAMVQKEPEE